MTNRSRTIASGRNRSPDPPGADDALGHDVNHPRHRPALDEQDARDPDERGALDDLKRRRFVRRRARGLYRHVFAVQLEPEPFRVDGVSLQPLQARLQPRPFGGAHEERAATLAPLQDAPLHEPRHPGPHRDPRDAQRLHKLGLGRYPIPDLVAAPEQQVLHPPLYLQVEWVLRAAAPS